MKKKLYFFFPLIVLMIISCTVPSVIRIKVLKPATISMPEIKEVAVVDFRGPDRSGSQIATLLQSKLIESNHFDIIEREKINRVLEEQNMGMSGVMDEETAVEIGKVLGVDGMIFGEVTQYEVSPDKEITQKVKKKKFTGKYRTVEKKDKKAGKTKKVKEKIYEDVWVDETHYVRQGDVAVNFRVVNVKTGQLLAAYSDSKSYNSQDEKGFLAAVSNSPDKLKPKSDILRDLSEEVCTNFAHMIAPHYMYEKRYIEPGKGNIAVGKKFAEQGLWPEAQQAWQEAVMNMPQESAGYYNLGLSYEVQGNLVRAEELYKQAVNLQQKDRYMESLARIRKNMKEREKLEEQLRER
ncbi:MAG: DUF6340 family protein [bacterium]